MHHYVLVVCWPACSVLTSQPSPAILDLTARWLAQCPALLQQGLTEESPEGPGWLTGRMVMSCVHALLAGQAESSVAALHGVLLEVCVCPGRSISSLSISPSIYLSLFSLSLCLSLSHSVSLSLRNYLSISLHLFLPVPLFYMSLCLCLTLPPFLIFLPLCHSLSLGLFSLSFYSSARSSRAGPVRDTAAVPTRVQPHRTHRYGGYGALPHVPGTASGSAGHGSYHGHSLPLAVAQRSISGGGRVAGAGGHCRARWCPLR